jgi:hypothetical protein
MKRIASSLQDLVECDPDRDTSVEWPDADSLGTIVALALHEVLFSPSLPTGLASRATCGNLRACE